MLFLTTVYRKAASWYLCALPTLLALGCMCSFWLNVSTSLQNTIAYWSCQLSLTYLSWVLLSHIQWTMSEYTDEKFWAKLVLNRLSLVRNWRHTYKKILTKTFHLQQIILVLGYKNSGKSSFLTQAGAKSLGETSTGNNIIVSQQWWEREHAHYLECSILAPNILSKTTSSARLTKMWRNLIYSVGWYFQYPSFDGVLVTISATSLQNTSPDHPSAVFDEISNQITTFSRLSPATPIYLIITNLDKLLGFDYFFQYMDITDFEKVLGFTLKNHENANISDKISDFTHDLENYLLYVLEKKPDNATTSDTAKLHAFQESFYLIQANLSQLVAKITARTALFGVFYTSSRSISTTQLNAAQLLPQSGFHDPSPSNIQQPCFVKNVLKSIKKSYIFCPSQSTLTIILGLALFCSCLVHQLVPVRELIRPLFAQDFVEDPDSVARTIRRNEAILWQRGNVKPSEVLFRLVNQSTHTLSIYRSAPSYRTEQDLHESWDMLAKKVDSYLVNCRKNPQACINLTLSLLVMTDQIQPDASFLPSQRFPAINIDKQIQDRLLSNKPSNLPKEMQRPLLSMQRFLYQLGDQAILNFFLDQYTASATTNTVKDLQNYEPIVAKACDLRDRLSNFVPWHDFINLETCKKTVIDSWSKKAILEEIKSLKSISFSVNRPQDFTEYIDKIRYMHKKINPLYDAIQKRVARSRAILKNIPKTTHSSKKLAAVIEGFNRLDIDKLAILLDHLESAASSIHNHPNPSQQAFLWIQDIMEDPKLQRIFTHHANMDPIRLTLLQSFWDVVRHLAANHINKHWHDDIYQPFHNDIAKYFPFNSASSTEVDIHLFEQYMSPSGKLTKFINAYLQPFLQRGNQGLTWKRICGQPFITNDLLLSTIMSHTVIQAMYFPNGSDTATFEAIARYRHSSNGIKKIFIAQGDSNQTIDVVKPQAVSLKWPYPDQTVRIMAQLDNQEVITIASGEGEWALIRLLYKAIDRRFSQDRFSVAFKWHQHVVELELQSHESMSPFSSEILRYYKFPTDIIPKI